MREEDNELSTARNENIHWAQKPKYQKPVSANWNEANSWAANLNRNCYSPSDEVINEIASASSTPLGVALNLKTKDLC